MTEKQYKMPDYFSSDKIELLHAMPAHFLNLEKLLQDNRADVDSGFSASLSAKEIAGMEDQDPTRFYFVCYEKTGNKNIIGFIYVKFTDDEAYIGYLVDKNFRGKNMAKQMVQLIEDSIFENNPTVKRSALSMGGFNEASMKIAIKLGYQTKSDFTRKHNEYLRKEFFKDK